MEGWLIVCEVPEYFPARFALQIVHIIENFTHHDLVSGLWAELEDSVKGLVLSLLINFYIIKLQSQICNGFFHEYEALAGGRVANEFVGTVVFSLLRIITSLEAFFNSFNGTVVEDLSMLHDRNPCAKILGFIKTMGCK